MLYLFRIDRPTMRFKFFFLSLLAVSSVAVSEKKDKTYVKIVKVFSCEIPPKKWDTSSPMVTQMRVEKVGRDLTKMNLVFNVSTTFGPVQLGSRSYHIHPNAAKDLVFKMENVNCRSILALKLISLMNLKFDKKCMLQKGIYKMENIDPNSMKWMLRKTISLNGRYSYDVEFSHAKGVTSCYTSIIDIYV